MRKLKTAFGLTILALFSLLAAGVFLSPFWFAYEKGDSFQLLAIFVTWIPAIFVFYVGVFIASLFEN